ncbi:MAG: membrane integrity-associated transporter subunit PqiC [Candidatus Binatia bacterium]
MMRRPNCRLLAVAVGASLISLGGCATTQPTSYYVLASLPAARVETGFTPSAHSIAIGVGPIELPQYLDRPQIVTRASRNELGIAEFDRWAEPLKNSFANVLAENLSVLIPTDHIAVFPWNRSTPIDYQVRVEVTRFEGTSGGEVSLIARWSISGKNKRKVLMIRKSSVKESTEAMNYKSTVSAMNRALGNLSRQIAAAIKTVKK